MTLDDDLVASGRYLRLEISVPGRDARPVVVGFVASDDGTYLIGAGDPTARWPALLAASPNVRVTVGERRFEALAAELDERDPARGVAVRELILRYGTPSEGVGRGSIFRLTPTGP